MRVPTAVFLVCAYLFVPTSGFPRKVRGVLNAPDDTPSTWKSSTSINPRSGALNPPQKTSQPSNLKSFGAFAVWVVPVLIYGYGTHVTQTISDIIEGGINGDRMPLLWRSFSKPQLKALLAHLKTADPALGLYYSTSFFRFPMKTIVSGGWLEKAAPLCSIAAALLFGVSMAYAFSSLYNLQAKDPLSSWIVSAILILITIPCLPWLVWQIEYSGRELKGTPEKIFLPKRILSVTAFLNVWKYPWLMNLLVGLYKDLLPNLLPASLTKCGLESVQSLRDAGNYADPKNPPAKPLTKEGAEKVSVGVLFNMLYGVLLGINLLSFVTHFGFYKGQPLSEISTGCPYSTSLVHASRGTVNPLAVFFLVFMFALMFAGNFWGLWILSLFGF
jgi:hypothetical protein